MQRNFSILSVHLQVCQHNCVRFIASGGMYVYDLLDVCQTVCQNSIEQYTNHHIHIYQHGKCRLEKHSMNMLTSFHFSIYYRKWKSLVSGSESNSISRHKFIKLKTFKNRCELEFWIFPKALLYTFFVCSQNVTNGKDTIKTTKKPNCLIIIRKH